MTAWRLQRLGGAVTALAVAMAALLVPAQADEAVAPPGAEMAERGCQASVRASLRPVPAPRGPALSYNVL